MSTAPQDSADLALKAMYVPCVVETGACGSHGERYDGAIGLEAACVFCGALVTGWSCRVHYARLTAGQVECAKCHGPVKLTRVL